MPLRIKYFEEFKDQGLNVLLVSADEKASMDYLLVIIDKIIHDEDYNIKLNDSSYVKPYHEVVLTLVHDKSNKGLYMEKGNFVLEYNKTRWLNLKAMLKTLIVSENGHQYVDSESNQYPISLILSLNEYPHEWVGWSD